MRIQIDDIIIINTESFDHLLDSRDLTCLNCFSQAH
jgi:hypothetical protein